MPDERPVTMLTYPDGGRLSRREVILGRTEFRFDATLPIGSLREAITAGEVGFGEIVAEFIQTLSDDLRYPENDDDGDPILLDSRDSARPFEVAPKPSRFLTVPLQIDLDDVKLPDMERAWLQLVLDELHAIMLRLQDDDEGYAQEDAAEDIGGLLDRLAGFCSDQSAIPPRVVQGVAAIAVAKEMMAGIAERYRKTPRELWESDRMGQYVFTEWARKALAATERMAEKRPLWPDGGV